MSRKSQGLSSCLGLVCVVPHRLTHRHTHRHTQTHTQTQTDKQTHTHRQSPPTCECCLQFFHSRERLLRHLMQSSNRCRQFYHSFVEPMEQQEYEDAEKKSLQNTRCLLAQGHRRTHAPTPPVRVCGPYRPESFSVGVCHSRCLGGGGQKAKAGDEILPLRISG